MDARITTIVIGLVGVALAAVDRAPPPVDTRLYAVDGAWVEAREVDPPPPPQLADGSALRWDVPAPPCEAGAADATPARLSVNTATQAQLEALPGIGPALARRIMAERPYRQVADLDRVKGIGPATLHRLRPLVRP